MAWFGEGLSTLKGQLQHFTKEVLSEGNDESDVRLLKETQEKVQELEALCESQALEISALRQQNAQLLGGVTEDTGQQQVEDSGGNASRWWTVVEHKCDNGGQRKSRASNGTPKSMENQEEELREKNQLVEFLQIKLAHLEQDKHKVAKAHLGLEEQLNNLKLQHQTEVTQLYEQLKTGDSLLEKLRASENRVEELEGQLQQLQQQLLDHLSKSETDASDLRSEVEHTRWQLLQESGTQKAELLRARQDMVNRIIQMGEKSRGVELNMKKLKAEEQHLSADIAAIIHKLGDPEQQELIHGALNALELENQVLKLRNSQLESARVTDLHKSSAADANFREEEKYKSGNSEASEKSSKFFDSSRIEDDFDTMSVKSDVSELSSIKQALETQIAQLKSQIDAYKKDIKYYEKMKLDWSEEKKGLEKQLKELREQLKKSQEKEKGLTLFKEQTLENEELKKRLDVLTIDAKQAQDERDKATLEKRILSDEFEAMARVVQDVEAQLAVSQKEKSMLAQNLEELDVQHQTAIEHLLSVKKSLQKENETVMEELKNVKLMLNSASPNTQNTCDSNVQTDIENYEEFKKRYKGEFNTNLLNILNFEIPKEYHTSGDIVEALGKCCNEWKWKKDTLECKVAQLLKVNRDVEEKVFDLEKECNTLHNSNEALMEELTDCREGGLATIHESSEEHLVGLENEVDVLMQARSSLEADSVKLQKENDMLVRKLQSLETMLHNQQDLENEVVKGKNIVEQQKIKSECKLTQEETEPITKLKDILANTLQSESSLKVEADSLRNKISELESCIATQQAELTRTQREINSLRQDIDGAMLGKHKSETQVKELEMQLAKERTVIQEMNLLHQKHNEIVNDLEMKLSKRELLVNEEKSKEWKQKIHFLEQQLQETSNDKAEFERQCLNLQSNLTDQLALIADRARQFQELQLLIEQQNNEISTLKGVIGSKDEQVGEVFLQLSDTMEKLNSLQLYFSSKETELEQICRDKDIIDKELHEVTKEKISVEENCNELLSQLTDRERRLSELQILVSSLQEKLQDCVQCSLYKREIENLKAVNQEQKKKWETAEKLVQEKSEAVIELERECKRLLIVETQMKKREQEMTQLTVLAEEAEMQLEQASITSSDQAKEIYNLQQLIDEKEQTLQMMKQTMNQLEEEHLNFQALGNARDILQQEVTQWKVVAESSQQELLNLQALKLDLENENKRLQLEVVAFREQEQVLKELKENQEISQMSSHGVTNATLQRKECVRNVKNSCSEKSDIDSEMLHKDNRDIDNVDKFDFDMNMHHSEIPFDSIKNLKSYVEKLEMEKKSCLSILDQKSSENILLHADNERLLELLATEKSINSDLLEEKNKLFTEHRFQSSESSVMAKETIQNLSQMIKDKDIEIAALSQKYEDVMGLQSQQEELVRAVVYYQSEIQRLNILLTQEMNQSQELSQDLEQLKKNDVEGMREKELESLRKQVVILQEQLSTAKQPLHQNKELQDECAQVTEKLKEAELKIQYLESKVHERQDKELERLRLHLVTVEETYTQEAIKAEEQVKDLQTKLAQAEEVIKNSSTVYTSQSIRANQQIETLQSQARLIAQQRDEVQQKLSASEDQVQKHAASLQNLQAVLEQFQRDKEREIAAEVEKVYRQVGVEKKKQEELFSEMESLKVQLREAKEGLSAASRLGEQLDRKVKIINSLKEEVTNLNSKLSAAEEKIQSASLNVEGKVDRNLVKNLMVGYFMAPPSHRTEVLRVVATVLDFTQEERGRVGLDPGTGVGSGGGWLWNLLHPGGPAESGNTQSLSEAFVRFLENESRPKPQLRLLPETQSATQSRSPTPSQSSSSGTASQSRTPLLLTEVQLPTFGQFAIGRNSSSILKDVLKDS